ncbi:MAG: hypothetical protein ACRCVT_10675 [Leadbetterella sp.]
MDFREYLISKNIDPELFLKEDSSVFSLWAKDFEGVHPDSFTMNKKFLINKIRRKYMRIQES